MLLLGFSIGSDRKSCSNRLFLGVRACVVEVCDNNFSFYRICGISSFLQLLRSRYIPESREFQADKLEEDLVSTFVVGKPIIGNPSLLRTVFKFKKDQQQLVLEE